MWKILIDKPAMKFLLKQPKFQQERILRALNQLPEIGDIKPMSGYENLYRVRIGNYRALYTINSGILIVNVLTIGNRGDVYKSF